MSMALYILASLAPDCHPSLKRSGDQVQQVVSMMVIWASNERLKLVNSSSFKAYKSLLRFLQGSFFCILVPIE